MYQFQSIDNAIAPPPPPAFGVRSARKGTSGFRPSSITSSVEDSTSLGLSLMGKTPLTLPSLGDVPPTLTISKDSSLVIEVLEILARSGKLGAYLSDRKLDSSEEILLSCLNKWLRPRSKPHESLLEFSASLEIKESALRLNIHLSRFGDFVYGAAYTAINALNKDAAAAFHRNLATSLNELMRTYDLQSALFYHERLQELDQDEEDESNHQAALYDFSTIPELLKSGNSKSERRGMKMLPTPPKKIFPEANIRAILRNTSRLKRLTDRLTEFESYRVNRCYEQGQDDDSYFDGEEYPAVVFRLETNDVIGQAFDDENQNLLENEQIPTLSIRYRKGEGVVRLFEQLNFIKTWLAAVNMVAALERQISKLER